MIHTDGKQTVANNPRVLQTKTVKDIKVWHTDKGPITVGVKVK